MNRFYHENYAIYDTENVGDKFSGLTFYVLFPILANTLVLLNFIVCPFLPVIFVHYAA